MVGRNLGARKEGSDDQSPIWIGTERGSKMSPAMSGVLKVKNRGREARSGRKSTQKKRREESDKEQTVLIEGQLPGGKKGQREKRHSTIGTSRRKTGS